MIRLLDTNVGIELLRKRNRKVASALDEIPKHELVICSIVRIELEYGAVKSTDPTANLARVAKLLALMESLPFDDAAADYAARIKVELEASGSPIGPYDLLIAAIAVVNGAILVTHNTSEFSRVPNLAIEDWQI